MNEKPDDAFEKYADMDFSNAKKASEVPALAELQAEQKEDSEIDPKLRIE